MSNLEKKITELVALGVDGVRAASIPPAVAQECARRWLVDAARDSERARAREIERAAMASAHSSFDEIRVTRLREEAKAAAACATFEAWADSQTIELSRPRRDGGRETLTHWLSEGLGSRRHFKYHEARKLYESDDHDAARKILIDDIREKNTNVSALIHEERRAWRNAVDEKIEERAAALGIEWTAALLTTTVALPDGTRVEWGEATREQHAARLDMLAKHAATELETATRHRAAIDTLDAAGARCLNEIAKVAA